MSEWVVGARVVWLPKNLRGTVIKTTQATMRSGRKRGVYVVKLDQPEPNHHGGRVTAGERSLIAEAEHDGRFMGSQK